MTLLRVYVRPPSDKFFSGITCEYSLFFELRAFTNGEVVRHKFFFGKLLLCRDGRIPLWFCFLKGFVFGCSLGYKDVGFSPMANRGQNKDAVEISFFVSQVLAFFLFPLCFTRGRQQGSKDTKMTKHHFDTLTLGCLCCSFRAIPMESCVSVRTHPQHRQKLHCRSPSQVHCFKQK